MWQTIKPNDRRAPFMTFQHDKTAIYHALSNNNAKIQKTLTVLPDAKAVPKACASPDKIKKIAKTASRLHVNILCRYNSQFLTVLYSKKKTLCTGASLPNYYIAAKYEKAFAVWGNSTFGNTLSLVAQRQTGIRTRHNFKHGHTRDAGAGFCEP